MQPLQPPDTFHLSGALGWLELGNAQEAVEDLEKITPASRSHPEVLEVGWLIYEQSKNWRECLDIAVALIKAEPDDANGYIKRSFALRRVEGMGLKAAYEALLEIFPKFSNNPIIPYNLACYQCQLGNPDRARSLLEEAFQIGNRKRLKHMALADADLEPLWKEIRERS